MKQRNWDKFTVTQSELSRLTGRSFGCIAAWTKYGGLPKTKNGRYHLRTTLVWIENHYREKATIQISLSALDQFQLSDLLGVSRQTINKWVRLGMPWDEKRFDLQLVCRWMSGRYIDKNKKIKGQNY